MSREQILQRLVGVMEESSIGEVDWSVVTAATTVESFGFDSLAVLDLIFDLEQEFGVQIEAEEMLGMSIIGDIISFLEQRKS